MAQSPKINVDGAVFERQWAVGIGVVIRDHLGLVRAALSMKIHALLGPLEIEAKVMEEGMRFAWDQGISTAIFERLHGGLSFPHGLSYPTF